MVTQIRTRYAPSPTGAQTIGNVRAALYNWLFAKKHGGSFMLRIDDTDQNRSKPEYEDAIRRDMTWLGLTWDHTARQSERMAGYQEVADKLKAAGKLYACYETQDELALKRKARLAQGQPPAYDRAALNLTDAEKAAFEAQGRKPHWRFLLDRSAPITWEDGIQGTKTFDPADLGDQVMIREDGLALYNFCSIIDDINDGTTHLIRGEDHISNTAQQVQLAQAIAPLLGKTADFQFSHFPRFMGADGEKMSKRLGNSTSLEEAREDFGLEALALNIFAGRLGTSLPMEPMESLEVLAQQFELSTISRNPPKVDMDDLQRLNGKLLHNMPFDQVEFRLHQLGLEEANEGFWLAVRGELQVLNDVKLWWDVVHSGAKTVIEDASFAADAAAILPPEPWDATTFSAWAKAVAEKTGKKGKALFMPLRLALTGQEHGPDMGSLLPLIGRMRVLTRLNGGHQ